MLQMLHSLTSLDGQKKQVEARSVSELLVDIVDMLSTPQQSGQNRRTAEQSEQSQSEHSDAVSAFPAHTGYK